MVYSLFPPLTIRVPHRSVSLFQQAPVANTPPVTAIGAKAVIGGAAQPAKTPQPPLTGIGKYACLHPHCSTH